MDSKEFSVLWAEAKLEVFKTMQDCNMFQVMVFNPFSNVIKASPWLCIYNECQVDNGSSLLFTEYSLEVEQLKKINLKSAQSKEYLEEKVNEVLISNSICGLAAETKSCNSIWFAKLHNDQNIENKYITGWCSHKICPGQTYLHASYYGKKNTKWNSQIYMLMNKMHIYFYKERIEYPHKFNGNWIS